MLNLLNGMLAVWCVCGQGAAGSGRRRQVPTRSVPRESSAGVDVCYGKRLMYDADGMILRLLFAFVVHRLSGIPGLVVIKQDGSLITLDGMYDHPDVYTLYCA